MNDIHKLKLTGDGTSPGTQLIDLTTGENILARYPVASIRIETNGRTWAGPKVTLELHPACVEVEIKSPSRETLDIFYPGLIEAFHLDKPGVEETLPAKDAEKA